MSTDVHIMHYSITNFTTGIGWTRMNSHANHTQESKLSSGKQTLGRVVFIRAESKVEDTISEGEAGPTLTPDTHFQNQLGLICERDK